MVQIIFEHIQKTLTGVVEYLEYLEVLDITDKNSEGQKRARTNKRYENIQIQRLYDQKKGNSQIKQGIYKLRRF